MDVVQEYAAYGCRMPSLAITMQGKVRTQVEGEMKRTWSSGAMIHPNSLARQ
jgi:hypothetical protein